MSRYFLRYLLFVGVPYIIARKIEKHLKNKERSRKKLTDNNFSSENSEKPLSIRGGIINPITAWFYAAVFQDFAIKVAIVSAVNASIWGDSADMAVQRITKYAGAVTAVPGNKLRRVVQKLRKVDPTLPKSIQEIILDKELTNSEKAEMLRIQIEYSLKNIKGKKRIKFLLFILAVLIFFFGKSFPLVAWVMKQLQELVGDNGDVDEMKDYLIELYQDYNAPLPKKLVETISEEL